MSTRHDLTIGQTTAGKVAQWLTARGVDAATIRGGLGLWEGALEDSVTVTIIGASSPAPATLASLACRAFHQDCTLLERWERDTYTAYMVYANGGRSEIL